MTLLTQRNEQFGASQSVTFLEPLRNLTFTLNEKYPLSVCDGSEGETIEFSNSLLINILWPNITDYEREFLNRPCQRIAIYYEELCNVVMLDFEFTEGGSIKAFVLANEESVQSWARAHTSVETAFFFLTERTNLLIQHIRALNLPYEFIRELQAMLINYKKPDPEQVKQLILSAYFEEFLKSPTFMWAYSPEDQKFQDATHGTLNG